MNVYTGNWYSTALKEVCTCIIY